MPMTDTPALAGLSLTESFQRTLDSIGDFLPQLLGALIVLVIGTMIAKALRGLIHKGLTKMGVDGLVDRSGLGGHLARAGYPDSALLLARVIYIGLMLLVLQLTVDVLGIESIQTIVDDFVAFIPKIFVAIVIVFIAGAVANVVREIVGGLTSTQSWGAAATNVATGAIWLIGVFAALDQIEVAQNVVDTLFQAIVGSLAFILVIKFGVGGIWAARDRFWPAVYDRVGAATSGDLGNGGTPSRD